MPSTRKVTGVKNKDVVFGVLVHNDKAIVVPQQGEIFLKVADDPQPFFLPPGIEIPAEYYGTVIDVTIRDLTHEVVLTLGEDDIYEHELSDSPKRIIPVDNWHEVRQMFDELRLQKITEGSKAFSTCFAGIALAGVSAFLHFRGFQPDIAAKLGMAIGAFAIAFCMLKPVRLLVQVLRTEVVWDSAGNYINLKTGETNLNGGLNVPREVRGE